MTNKDRIGKIIKVTVAGFAVVTLSCWPALIPLDDRIGIAPHTFDTIRPAQIAYTLIAFGIIGEIVDFQHRASTPVKIIVFKELPGSVILSPRFSY